MQTLSYGTGQNDRLIVLTRVEFEEMIQTNASLTEIFLESIDRISDINDSRGSKRIKEISDECKIAKQLFSRYTFRMKKLYRIETPREREERTYMQEETKNEQTCDRT